VVDVTDADPGTAYLAVFATLGSASEQTVYRRGVFKGDYVAGSFVTTIANGLRLTIYRAGGWPTGTTVAFAVDAADAAGNVAA
jgi:hypothetical protein